MTVGRCVNAILMAGHTVGPILSSSPLSAYPRSTVHELVAVPPELSAFAGALP